MSNVNRKLNPRNRKGIANEPEYVKIHKLFSNFANIDSVY